ncbi:MAG TPA: phosphoglycerate kinase [Solirubrobacterales bacterium]|nr:phosphoglycerate kinase [Solirubrobacterales bacterium]
MSLGKASVRDADVAASTVLVRVDFNVPLEDGRVADDMRIRAALPTLELLRERRAATILVSHLGRPEGTDSALSMRPVGERLAELTGAPVTQAPAVAGGEVDALAAELGEGDLMLLENSRFDPGETENDPDLARRLAAPVDLFVNDAFGASHRAHATTVGVAELLPSYAGLLLESEVEHLTAVAERPRRPLTVVLGGAKVSDKIGVIDRFLEIADEILIGGAMCFCFFRAQGIPTGDSLVEEEGVPEAERALHRAAAADCRLELPVDLVLGRDFNAATERRDAEGIEVSDGWMGLDVGPRTAEAYAKSVGAAGTVLWNGPMGAFELEPFAAGTRTLAEAVADAPGTTVVGGGDSVAALRQFGLDDRVDWLSTGGGASLELLEGKPLPGVEALQDA